MNEMETRGKKSHTTTLLPPDEGDEDLVFPIQRDDVGSVVDL